MHPFCQLAKKAVETYLKEGQVLSAPKRLPASMKKRAGVFVTLYTNKCLRGCIGTYRAIKKNLAEEIIANAISAATQDWRFSPISLEELPSLSYEVSVLEKPEPVKNLNELNPQEFGIIIKEKKSQKSTLLLPNLPGITSGEEQIAACLSKAGLSSHRENTLAIYKFKAKKYL